MSSPMPSRALWNRSALDLRSDEILAQILERGDLASWRVLYAQARSDRATAEAQVINAVTQSRYTLDAHAPAFTALYREPALRAFLERLCGQPLLYCPPDDAHAYALYYYTEPGDHIGYHYDTSYYKGARYTVLIGLIDESSCKLEYELFHDHPTRSPVPGAISLAPGTLVVFNGDKLWHRITPAAAGDRRIALTLEYVTSHAMHPLRRFVSNMKDAIAYFGFRQVFSGSRRR